MLQAVYICTKQNILMNGCVVMIITLTGDLGSGKSSIAKVLAQKGYRIVSIGSIFREIARQRNVSVVELNKLAETDATIDKYVDDYQAALNDSQENIVLDSRLGWYFVPNSFKVFVSVDIAKAAKHIFNATGRTAEEYNTIEETRAAILQRQEYERSRYYVKYNADLRQMSNYNLIVDSTNATPKQIAHEILIAAKLKCM